jgi:hypothetical protein
MTTGPSKHLLVAIFYDLLEVSTADQQADHFLINLSAFFESGRPDSP